MSAPTAQTLFEAVAPLPERVEPCIHCGATEPNAYLQRLNHTPLRGTCMTLALRRTQAAFDGREVAA